MLKKPVIKRDKKGRFTKGNLYTFKKHPERINKNGYWSSEDSISFQYKHLIKMTANEFDEWKAKNPKKNRTIAQEIAYQAVQQARSDLQYLKELTDRTEGKAPQSIDLTNKGERFSLFDDEQAEKIARRVARGAGGDGNTPSEKKSN